MTYTPTTEGTSMDSEDDYCRHYTRVQYRRDPVYDDQKGLRPGETRCRDCKRVLLAEDWV